jgi:hypothetical protein
MTIPAGTPSVTGLWQTHARDRCFLEPPTDDRPLLVSVARLLGFREQFFMCLYWRTARWMRLDEGQTPQAP